MEVYSVFFTPGEGMGDISLILAVISLICTGAGLLLTMNKSR